MVTMTEWTPILTLTRALIAPTASAAPRAISTLSHTGRPTTAISQAEKTALRLITAPVERSISPEIISITMPMATMPG